LRGSGLGRPSDTADLVLFNRVSCGSQIDFILNVVIGTGANGYIYGQPGTGKSTTTFWTACSLRNEWDIVWISLDGGLANIVFIEENHFGSIRVSSDDLRRHVNVFISPTGDRKTSKRILILDSLTITDSDNKKLMGQATAWAESDKGNRRLICVSSMGSNSHLNHKFLDNYSEHGVGLWTLEEYIKAVAEDKFWKNVEHVFADISRGSNDSRTDLVSAKFYFAGTSARFMFEYSVFRIVNIIEKAVYSLSLAEKESTRADSIFSNSTRHTLVMNTALVGRLPRTLYEIQLKTPPFPS